MRANVGSRERVAGVLGEGWWAALERRTTRMGRTPWFSVKQNEGMGDISPHRGVRCSSITAGSQPVSAESSNKTKNAIATPSAAASSSSSSDLIVSISFGSGTLHGAPGASPSSISSPVADVGRG